MSWLNRKRGKIMSEQSGKKEDKSKVLKGIIKSLHEGADLEEIKVKFREAIKDVTPVEIAQVEEELIKEGMPSEEIRKLCEVHIAVFRESLEKERALAPAGHPIHILMEEHKILLEFAEELEGVSKGMKAAKDLTSAGDGIKLLDHFADHLKESESHYLREENVLFPYLERHGITQPPAIMWMDHAKIREIKKNFYQLVDAREKMVFRDFTRQMGAIALELADMLSNHFYKENNILFPTALKVIGENEWRDIRKQFDEIGYCCFTPESARGGIEETRAPTPKPEMEGAVTFETGTLSKEAIEAIFNNLPVDITFVDKDDTVRYFSQSKDRIFVRTKAVIGRKVQQCHPQKSVHVVNRLLEDFKGGRRDVGAFWINLEGRLILIRYYPIRSKNGEYLGCIEVTQDITDIKKIEGEKRLL
jgi:PAS domain S-box-containing protein